MNILLQTVLFNWDKNPALNLISPSDWFKIHKIANFDIGYTTVSVTAYYYF